MDLLTPFPPQLTVLVPYFNYQNFKSRKLLHRQFIEYLQQINLPYIEVEASLDDNFFTSGLHYRVDHALWHKENLLNRALHYVTTPYVAWIDADLLFTEPTWPTKTIERLQNCQVVQLFSQSYDLCKKQTILQSSYKPGYAYNALKIKISDCDEVFDYSRTYHHPTIKCTLRGQVHPGFAWAAQTDFLRNIGGFLDTVIAGCGDRWMADIFALGHLKHNLLSDRTSLFQSVLGRFYDHEGKYLQMFDIKHYLDNVLNVPMKLGYIDNTVCHYWHGQKVNRKYVDRIKDIEELGYNSTLLEYNDQLMYRLKPTSTGSLIRQYLESYFSQRQEDE